MAESELTTVARPYARAAFSEALNAEGGLARWSNQLGQAAAAVLNDTVATALDNPLLTKDQKAALLVDVMGDELDQQGKNFVAVLAENDRIMLLPTILDMFQLLKANHEKTMDVELVSAYEVDAAEQDKLGKALSEKLQREVNISSSVDASLIGGVVVRAEDTVIDNSVRGKLNKLSQAMS